MIFKTLTKSVLLVVFILVQTSSFSQTYRLKSSNGVFTPISEGVNISSIQSDDAISDLIDIGFEFVFSGETYSQLKVCSNGYITFNTLANSPFFRMLAEPGPSNRPIIAPLYDDLSGYNGTASYKLEGVAPNRVFTIEWLNWGWNYMAENAVISFQVKLYETTNKIDFVYRQEAGDIISGSASSGLSLSVSGFYSLSDFGTNPTLSSTFETSSIETKPATGQIYNFESIILPEPTNHASVLAATNYGNKITLNWLDATGETIPDGYLILASKTNSFTDPTDLTDITDDPDLSDGISCKKISAKIQKYSGFSNAEFNSTYYFKLYPYTNAGNKIDFKIDPEAPQTSITCTPIPEPSNHVTAFSASTNGSDLNLTWTDASGETIPDGYLIFVSKTNNSTHPIDGTEPDFDNDFANDGFCTIKVNNQEESYTSFQNIEPLIKYYARIYSYTNFGNHIDYKTDDDVPTDSILLIKPEPTNHATVFTVENIGGIITMNWTDATGPIVPDGYLVLASTTNSFADPADNLEVENDLDLGDGNGVVKIAAGIHTFSGWTNSNSNISYYFKLFSYTNSGNFTNYKTSGSVPTAILSPQITYTEVTNALLTGLTNRGTTELGDYNNDGFLDIIMTGIDGAGSRTSRIYKNNGDDTFTDQSGDLIGVEGGNAVWADYNNDGFLDIFHTGISNFSVFSKLLRNNGDGTFSENTNLSLTPLEFSSGSFVDYNNDGYLDFIYSGRINFDFVTKIYKNNGNETFTEQVGISLPGVVNGTFDWGDFNNDGYVDLIYSGSSSGNWTTKIYKNNGNGNFTELQNTGFVIVTSGSTEWGDYDNDGYLDILICGMSSDYNCHAKLYRNNGDETFSHQTDVSLTGISSGTGSWGDYNKDGYLDILLVGSTWGSQISKIYRNNGAGSFSEDMSISLPGVGDGSGKWGDFDRDGDLDIILTGKTSDAQKITKLFRNNGFTPNQVPTVPTNLNSVVVGRDVTLSWDKATDFETNQSGLSYNLYIGTSPDKFDIHTPHADTALGLRTIVKRGLIQTNQITLKNLNGGTYYWSVQAIDNNFSGSEFATQSGFSVIHFNSIAPEVDQVVSIGEACNTLTVTESLVPDSRQWKYSFSQTGPFDQVISGATEQTFVPQFNEGGNHYVVCISKFGEVEVVSNCVKINVQTFSEQVNDPAFPNVHSGSTAWGDYNNDGLLDLLLTGLPGHAYNNEDAISQVYKNNGDGTFSPQSTIELTGVYRSSVDWGDYDNDGYLDILLTGTTENFYSGAVSKVYRNNHDNTFTEQTDFELTAVHMGTARWCDFDNDGDLDILLAGQGINGNSFFKIYQNTNSFFVEKPSILIPFYEGQFDLGDFNKDSYIDIISTGLDFSGNKMTNIYKNNGDGTFTLLSSPNITQLNRSSVAWGDYDNDGFLDILLAGTSDGWTATTKLFKNNGNETFTEQTSISLLGVNIGSVAWGDYNNDGFSDIILNGSIREWPTGGYSKVYRNTGTGSFVEDTNIPLIGLSSSATSWCDYDNDGDLDFFILGEKVSEYNYFSKLYRNNYITPNQNPTAPNNLSSVIVAGKVSLKWNKATDLETPSSALTYNLQIANAADTSTVKNPMSDLVTGFRTVVGQGNAGNDTTFVAVGLNTGAYVWRVQTIDNAYAASEFSEWSDFEILAQYTDRQVIMGYEHATTNWVDIDNNGNLDIFITGYDGHNGSISKVIENQGNNSYNFVEKTEVSLPCVVAGINGGYSDEDFERINKNGATAWGDYNNDGFLDLLIAGSYSNSDNSPENALTKLYSNNGDWTFTEMSTVSLPKFAYGPSVAWVDFDNDGHQDIFLTGVRYQQLSGYGTSAILRNNGDSTFTEINNINITSVTSGNIDFGDYDNDGYLDIIVTGSDYAKLYHNTGDGSFTIVANTPFTRVKHSFAVWGDYNNDGFLDLLITGMDTNNRRLSKIYRNNTNGTFTDINVFMQGMSGGVVSWGDYDNDGDLDILMTGASSNNTNAIFENNGNDSFTEKDFGFDKLVNGYSAFGDFDNDGDLDVIASGKAMLSNNSYTTRTRVHQNNGNYVNQAPTAPSNLNTNRIGDRYRFLWGAASDDNTPSGSLTYNLRIGTVSGGRDVLSPLALIDTSKLLLPQMGNCQLSRSKIIKSLKPGTYYWSVQAIDQTYKAGEWAAEQTLTVYPTIADFSADTACNGLPTQFTDLSISSNDPIVGWSWDFGDTTSISTLQNPQHTYKYSGTHTVQLIVTNSSGMADTIYNTVLVKPIPNVTFTANDVCSGTTTSIDITNTNNGLTITNWDWDFGDGQTSNYDNPGSHVYSSLGSYTIQLKVKADNLCSTTISKNIVVTTTPITNLTLEYGKASFCMGDSVIYSVPSNPIYTYQWQRDGEDIPETSNIIRIKNQSGNYRVNITNTLSNLCSASSAEKTITIKSNPVSPIIDQPITSSFCSGDSILLQTIAQDGMDWLINGVSTGNSSNLIYAKTSGEYSIRVINTDLCEVLSTNSVNLTMNPTPALPTVSAGETTICYGENVSISVANNATLNYQWYNNNQSVSGATSNIILATLGGNYKLQLTNASSCSVFTDPIAVTVNPTPTSPFIEQPASNSFCSGDSILLQTSAQDGLEWLLNGIATNQHNNTFHAKGSGTYRVRAVNEYQCEALSSNSIQLTMNPAPITPTVSYGNASFCQGESITFSVSPNANYTYQWRKDNEDIVNATSNTYTANEQGEYNLLITNTNLCSTATPLVFVNVNTMPSKPSIIVENNNTLFCPGSIVKLMVPDSIAEINYQWKRSGINIDGAGNPSYKGKLSAGDYRVEARLGECAIESDILTLNTKPAPSKPDIFAKGPNVWIVGCSNDKASDYTWYYNNNPIPGAKTHYYVANRNLGDYYVEIKEGNECSTKSDIISIPTGDVINDIPNLSEESIQIFPNPTESQFNVTLGGTIKGLLYVDILNSTGRVMQQHQFADTDGFFINISELPKGIYLCKIRHNGNVLVKKVVKQ